MKGGNGNGDKGGGQATVTVTNRVMVTATRMIGKQRQWQ
jgi:hypothetical protein